ncbi:MAG: hypothetical protein WD276_05595 [Actinomycetota bacterium]
MKRLFVLPMLAAALMAASCAQPKNRDFQRYYDPAGLFSTEFPSGNNVETVQPSDLGGGTRILGGARSLPPIPSQGSTGLGSIGGQDQTMYEVNVLDPGLLMTAHDLSTSLYASFPFKTDVEIRRNADVSGRNGLLVVAAHESEGGEFGTASAFLVGNGNAYWILTVFPDGSWEQEQSDFMRVLRSFKTEAPPFPAAPISSPTA